MHSARSWSPSRLSVFLSPPPPPQQLIDALGAILVSITAILIFGEIIPQSICARHGLAIGAFLAWPVRILMWICSPIA